MTMNKATGLPVSLHGEDYPPTRIERALFDIVFDKLEAKSSDHHVKVDDLIAELVKAGLPAERAELVVEAVDVLGAQGPVPSGGKPPLDWLIRKHWELPPVEFFERITKYYPAITVDEIMAAMDAHIARLRAEADASRRIADIHSAWVWANPGRETVTWGECAADLDLVAPNGRYDLNRLKLAGRKMVEAWKQATGGLGE
jgi:hypothetical protein